MAVRASDTVTLAVLPAVTYTRPYYLLQASNLAVPAKPTTNPPSGAWSATEPAYTAGSTNTLYMVWLVVYGTAGFEYGDVQKSSSFEAAKQAYNLALSKANVPIRSTSPASGAGSNGDIWEQWSSLGAGGRLLKFWRHNGTTWLLGEIDESYLPAVDIGEGTYGTLTGGRLDAASFWADEGNLGVLRAGIIEVDMLMPNVGETLNLVANEAVQFIVGRQDTQDAAIAAAQQAADNAEDDAQAAQSTAGAAVAAAAVADGKALVAQSQAQAVSDRLTTHQSVFRVTAAGAEVASVDGANVLALTPTGVQIMQGGTAASTWDAGRLIVNEIIINRAQQGNHIAEKSGTTRTVFRPI